ncbi:MAG: helix-turn-helix domain-containing protein [Candidatus Limnocylindrales bacterium]
MWEPPDASEVERTLVAFGSVLREARHARGMSQRALEGRAGPDQTTISRLERGLAPSTRLDAVCRIIAALDPRILTLSRTDRYRGRKLGGQRWFAQEPIGSRDSRRFRSGRDETGDEGPRGGSRGQGVSG